MTFLICIVLFILLGAYFKQVARLCYIVLGFVLITALFPFIAPFILVREYIGFLGRFLKPLLHKDEQNEQGEAQV